MRTLKARGLTTRGVFTRVALAVRGMEQPGRRFCSVRRDDGTVEVVRRVGTVETPIGVVRADLTLEPGAYISQAGGLVDERARLRGILAQLRGEAA